MCGHYRGPQTKIRQLAQRWLCVRKTERGRKTGCTPSHIHSMGNTAEQISYIRRFRMAGGSRCQISLRPSSARMRVASSAYSRWLPTGMP